MRWTLVILGLGVAGATLTAAPAGVRNLFLNGIDISSAKSQELKNVDVTINERGDIFIIAPHYQVHEEDSYVPLSKYVQNMSAPQHKAPQPIAADAQPAPPKLEPAMAVKVPTGSNPGAPESQQPKSPTSDAKDTPPAGEDGLATKAGTKLTDPAPPTAGEKKPDEPKKEPAEE